jgi:hypothetical protein
MDVERWALVKQIFHAAVDLPAAERPAALDAACGRDAALRRDVESLLMSHEGAGSFLGSSPRELVAEDIERLVLAHEGSWFGF